MQIVMLLQFLRENWGYLASLGAGFGGWYGNVLKARLQRQRNEIDASQIENEQLRLALNRERFLTDRLTDLGEDNEVLWRRLYNREGVIKTYHSAALAARRRVSELEGRAGLPETVFADLPEFPPADEEKMAAIRQAGQHERGEHYDDGDSSGSAPGSPVGGRKEIAGQEDNRPTRGN